MTAPREVNGGALLDAVAFQQQVVAVCQPAVLRDLCAAWPVREAASRSPSALADHLLSFDAGLKAEAFVGDPQIKGRYHYGEAPTTFNFERASLSLAEVLTRLLHRNAESGETVYMGSLPVDDYLPGFAAANSLPILPAFARPRLWIGDASIVACHYDTYDNLACVVAGRRRFTLYPPDVIGDLYVGPIDHTLSGQPISLAAGAPVGDPRYPRFEAARERALVVELGPSDALYLPKLWWHQVEALESLNLMVNYWWDAFSAGPDAPYAAMLLAMITLAERPEAERAAWRAFYDHYVFRTCGHPLAHLPEAQRGVLGPLSEGAYGRIRALVMRLLRGA